LQKADDPIPVCPFCGKKKVEKLISAPAVQFKGTGWTPKHYGSSKE
jgi:putative FmdB family regulatory protein